LFFWGRALHRFFRHSILIAAAAGIAALCLAAYWPGLRGSFLFDDYGNLDALGALGPIHDWASFCRYITSGHADPSGRPLTMLTFLIDARDWPAAPWPFKRTNLFIHVLNGALLGWLLLALGREASQDARRVRVAALTGAALWLLHPLLVSTTLYVVQREAMLSTTCVMLGLLAWLHGRKTLLEGHRARGITWCLGGLIGFTLLGILAKANGALLPLLALAIETCLPAQASDGNAGTLSTYRKLFLLVAGLPSALLVAYLAWMGVHGMFAGGVVSGRNWTLAQRLLSEPRVLIDYLKLLWLPRPLSSGLFNDQYQASTSLFHPLSTLFAWAGVLALLGAAWMMRRRQPIAAVAVLFFFAGQLLESTSIPLELYYEHRNYLSALLMFWPLGWWLSDKRSLAGIKLALMFMLPLALAWMTCLRASEWGHPDAQAAVWARINPHSARAQTYAASFEIGKGQYGAAIARLEYALAEHPAEPQMTFNLVDAYCGTGALPPQALAAAVSAMHTTVQRGSLYASWFGHALAVARDGKCSGLTLDGIQQMVDAGVANPALQVPATQQDLAYVSGELALARGDAPLALNRFRHALDIQVRPEVALSAAATLGAQGFPQLGLGMLDDYASVAGQAQVPDPGMPHVHAWVLAYQQYWPKELAYLRRQLIADAMARHANP
jgi:protein O-mannosyl-transferase